MAIQNPVTVCVEDSIGNSASVVGTNGHIPVLLPQNSYGTVSVGEVAGTDTLASTTINFSHGLAGVTVANCCALTGAVTETDVMFVYVAFNNHAMNDVTLAGSRYVVGPNMSVQISFAGTPKPTQMVIRLEATECTAFYTAAEVI